MKKEVITINIHTIKFADHLGTEFNITFGVLTIHKLIPKKRILEIIESCLDSGKESIAARAKERQKTSTGGANPQLKPKSAEGDKGETREEIAKLAGIGKTHKK